ncbi:MAG: hypothetical protein HQL47_05890 [Gammaproteobacteria bacterium]|nr:hypothetical protein [Gammaproteobacteria bacterium]
MSTIVYNMIDGTFIDETASQTQGLRLPAAALELQLGLQDVAEAEWLADLSCPRN